MHTPIVIIALAGVAAFVFGAAYYMSLGKVWQRALDQQPKAGVGNKPPLGPMAICLVAEWVMATVMWKVITDLGIMGAVGGALAGATLGVGFMATSTFVNNAFPGRKTALSLIDSIHWIAVAAIEGAVICALAA